MAETLKKMMDDMGITNPNPSEMRNLLLQYAMNDALCHAVRRMGIREGVSDLDCMTTLAFNAIIARDQALEAYCSHMNLCVPHRMIFPAQPEQGGKPTNLQGGEG